MERIKALITKLQQQADKQADPSIMLVTLQLLQSELQQLQQQKVKTMGTSKVAVVMPSFKSAETSSQQIIEEAEAILKETYAEPPENRNPVYDPMMEIPTLSQQQITKDINESIRDSNISLNDRLKEVKKDLGDQLGDAPVKDLRKAIGINDRYTFISELFRGDESTYERSLKTINSFSIYPEAEYWISRELEIKLGWDTSSETVAHFYQLVKRRFS